MTSKPRLARKANAYGKADPQLYETPPEAVAALLASDPWLRAYMRQLWDPACGPGAIVQVLRQAGHLVLGTDLYDYSDRWKGGSAARAFGEDWDFLNLNPSAVEAMAKRLGVAGRYRTITCEAIIMNPPYNAGRGQVSLAAQFVAKALTLAPRVYALLPVTFPHAGGPQGCPLRDALFDGPERPFGLAWTGEIKIRERVTMHRDGWTGKKVDQGFINFSWFRWSHPSEPFLSTRATLRDGGRALSPVHGLAQPDRNLLRPPSRDSASAEDEA